MAIKTYNLTKIYGKKVGCKDVNIEIKKGEVFALLGPNGAGKSTFIKMLMGLLYPTSGSGEILGKPLGNVAVRRKIGYLPELFRYQEWMTGEDLLSFHASLYKMSKNERQKRIDEVLETVNLKGHERYKIGTYSKGMQQRIGLAGALLTDPDLLFLDEPTSALDPIGRKEVRDIITALKGRGKTVLLNSHLLSEVEMVCDSAAFINKGTIIKQGSLDKILESKTKLEVHIENLNQDIINGLKKIDPDVSCIGDTASLIINDREDIPNIAAMIVQKGGLLYELTTKKETLENKFITIIKGGEVS